MKIVSEVCIETRNKQLQFVDDPDYDPYPRSRILFGSCRITIRLLQNSTLDYSTLRANDIGLVVAGITLAQHILILGMKCRKCV